MNDDQKKEVFEFLMRHGVTRIIAMFDGSGDSGQIEETKIEGLTEDTDPKTVYVSNFPEEAVGYRLRKTPTSLYEAVDYLIDAFLQDTNYDWYNNDGGFGTVTLIPAAHYCHVDMNIRESTSHNYQLEAGLTPPSNLDPEVEAKCVPVSYTEWWG